MDDEAPLQCDLAPMGTTFLPTRFFVSLAPTVTIETNFKNSVSVLTAWQGHFPMPCMHLSQTFWPPWNLIMGPKKDCLLMPTGFWLSLTPTVMIKQISKILRVLSTIRGVILCRPAHVFSQVCFSRNLTMGSNKTFSSCLLYFVCQWHPLCQLKQISRILGVFSTNCGVILLARTCFEPKIAFQGTSPWIQTRLSPHANWILCINRNNCDN